VRKSRRQIINRIVETTGIVLVALDLLVFFAVYRPLGNKLEAVGRGQEELRQAVRNQQFRVDLLKSYEAALPHAKEGLQEFTTNRAPSRREAYSTAAHLIHKAADAAGVRLSTTAFHLELQHKDPLERLGVEINVQGPYASLMKFSHALETANDFILIREFTYTPGGENGAVDLRLVAELYLTP
jgi:Tfp pilus assembly protein PilO